MFMKSLYHEYVYEDRVRITNTFMKNLYHKHVYEESVSRTRLSQGMSCTLKGWFVTGIVVFGCC